MAFFEIIKHPSGEFCFSLKRLGGAMLLKSEGGYRTKDNCKKGIESVRQNSQNPVKFEVMRAPSGRTYFLMKSINGRTIGISEHFIDDASRETVMRAVRKKAPTAKIVDLTKGKKGA